MITALLLLRVFVKVLVLVSVTVDVGDPLGKTKPNVPVTVWVSDGAAPIVLVGGMGVSEGVSGRGDFVHVGGN
jgi:hypothetical protein